MKATKQLAAGQVWTDKIATTHPRLALRILQPVPGINDEYNIEYGRVQWPSTFMPTSSQRVLSARTIRELYNHHG